MEYEDRHKKGDSLKPLPLKNLQKNTWFSRHLSVDHLIEISPLTKKNRRIRNTWSVSEFFMNGWEMANAYSGA